MKEGTRRWISATFWSDKWVRSLDPLERYLFLFLMTNRNTTIAGIYEILLDDIAHFTGLDHRQLHVMLSRFSDAGKAHYFEEEWIILTRWPRHQRFGPTSNTRIGIDRILSDIPERVFSFCCQGDAYSRSRFLYDYEYLVDHDRYKNSTKPNVPESLRKPRNTRGDLDSDLDLDLDIDSDGTEHLNRLPWNRGDRAPALDNGAELSQEATE